MSGGREVDRLGSPKRSFAQNYSWPRLRMAHIKNRILRCVRYFDTTPGQNQFNQPAPNPYLNFDQAIERFIRLA